MQARFPFAHSHTHAMRTIADDEVLIVRVRNLQGSIGFGFTFCEDVTAARAMALADAEARAHNLPLRQWLAGQPQALVSALQEQAPGDPADHPWVRRWRSELGLGNGEPVQPAREPGHGIDWTREPEFSRLRWQDAPDR